MAIGIDYRMFFESDAESEHRTTLEITGGGEGEDARVWLSTPPNHGQHDFIVALNRKEARELTAILRVLFEEASEEDEELVDVGHREGEK